VFELLKMAHLITIAMVSGLLLSHYVALRASAGREAEAGMALARRTLADITSFGVAFAWITGLTLLWSQYGSGEHPLSSWFTAKFLLVCVLTLAHIMQRVRASQLRRAGDFVRGRRIAEGWVSFAWISALFVICLAVIAFK
jgi:uncharacterized membrane protein